MTPPYRKKLIEVALPLEAINRESAREKSIRHGHPSTLHLWWARRPLAACRAVLFSSLVDDPSSDPQLRKPDGSHDEDLEGERRAHLFNLIEELVKWENSNNDTIINAARAEIARSVASRKLELGELKNDQPLPGGVTPWDLLVRGQVRTSAQWKDGRAYIVIERTNLPSDAVNAFLAEHAPPVLDPFCGGGSIPLEAQRLGLRAFASDLNPVPVLITKALIEIPPKFAGRPPVNPASRGEAGPAGKQGKGKGQALLGDGWKGAAGLAEDVRYYGQWMRDEAEKRIGHLYPKVKITNEMAKDRPDLRSYVGQELTVIAWLWARTVPSPNPAAGGALVPLVRTFWLSQKTGKQAWVEPIVSRDANRVGFKVRVRSPAAGEDPSKGTVGRRGGLCTLTNTPMPLSYIRGEARSGRMRQQLLAIVAEGLRERVYLDPEQNVELMATSCKPVWRPEGAISRNHRDFHPPGYGMDEFGEIFSDRQLVALCALSDLVADVRALVDGLEQDNYSSAVATYLSFALSKCANYGSNLCAWATKTQKMISTFGRPGLPMVWDFAEANPFSESSGNFASGVDLVAKLLSNLPQGLPGVVVQNDAAKANNIVTPAIICTDPPYYDNIAYAECSDFFYLWLRRTIGALYPSLFTTMLTPKDGELIASPQRFGNDRDAACRQFERGLGDVFSVFRGAHSAAYPLTLFYAFKQAETEEGGDGSDATSAAWSTGWETMLEGLVQSGLSINATWPMRTELVTTLKKHLAVLASSIVLACRPRLADAPMTTRKDFVAALKKELPSALRDLQSGNIAPVDLAQAAIGPGMAIYSRHSKVVNSDGSRMPVRTALQLINQALDEVLSELESEFDSETRWAIKWFEQHAHDDGAYGTAETLSTAMAVSVKGLVDAGFVKAGQGKVRLLRRAELADNWDPTADTRLTIWEVTQHLIRRLEEGGDAAAADLLRKVGSLGEVARDLAYRLYSTCERKKWADEARSYNGLVVAWPEIGRLSREAPKSPSGAQTDFSFG